jgi:hypothetical protein
MIDPRTIALILLIFLLSPITYVVGPQLFILALAIPPFFLIIVAIAALLYWIANRQ